MTDIFIYPRKDMASTKDARATRIAELEAQFGAFPAGYRSFLSAYGGGLPFPNDIEFSDDAVIDRLGDDIISVFELYDLETVEQHLANEVYGDATPYPFLFVADAQGGLQIVMSMAAEDKGAVYIWPHTSTAAWGETLSETEFNTPDRLIPLAPSFPKFLDRFQQLPGSEVAQRVWDRGQRRAEAKKIEY